MMSSAKKVGTVVLAGAIASLPGGIAIQFAKDAPLWFLAIASTVSALGVGIIAIGVGLIVLLAARGRPGGGIKAAVVTTVIVGLLSSLSVIYGVQRGAA